MLEDLIDISQAFDISGNLPFVFIRPQTLNEVCRRNPVDIRNVLFYGVEHRYRDTLSFETESLEPQVFGKLSNGFGKGFIALQSRIQHTAEMPDQYI